MDQLTLKEIQEIELKLLEKFDSICMQNDLRYSLGGGSLLGAIRHKGFIPWDDDIDIIMPRPDYDRFLSLCRRNDDSFSLLTYDTCDGYYGLFAKMWDPDTIIEDEDLNLGPQIGVNIDLFPLDGLGRTEREATRIFRKTSWKRELLTAAVWKRYFRSKTHSFWIEPIRLLLFIYSRILDPKKLLRAVDEENLKHPFDQSLYAGCVCGSYRKKEIMKKSTFENYINVEFEGQLFKCIRNYDEYLTKHYGDYMRLPPEEKRVTHHTYKAYYIRG